MYGINGDAVIPYIQRNNEGNAAFLNRLMNLEGAVLKCVNGKFIAIGIQYAQDKKAPQTINLQSTQKGCQYKYDGMKMRTITLKNLNISASATDTDVPESHNEQLFTEYPVLTSVQAGRWARNKLLCINRESETIRLDTVFNPKITAMVRMNIVGDTSANGRWLVDDVEHDLINLNTYMTLKKCIQTIQ